MAKESLNIDRRTFKRILAAGDNCKRKDCGKRTPVTCTFCDEKKK